MEWRAWANTAIFYTSRSNVISSHFNRDTVEMKHTVAQAVGVITVVCVSSCPHVCDWGSLDMTHHGETVSTDLTHFWLKKIIINDVLWMDCGCRVSTLCELYPKCASCMCKHDLKNWLTWRKQGYDAVVTSKWGKVDEKRLDDTKRHKIMSLSKRFLSSALRHCRRRLHG